MAVIDPTILATLVTALTVAITTAFSNVAASQPVLVKSKTHSSVIDTYDSNLMDLRTNEGKYQCYIVTKPEPGWTIIAVTVKNADKLMGLLKYRIVQFGLNGIMKIQTAGNGEVETAARTIFGVDHWNTNLGCYKNFLPQFHCPTLDQVRAFSVWSIG